MWTADYSKWGVSDNPCDAGRDSVGHGIHR